MDRIKSEEKQSMPNSPRKPYDVYAKRVKDERFWFGMYRDAEGKRKQGIPLWIVGPNGIVPSKIAVTRDDPKHCPNRDQAMEAMRTEYLKRTSAPQVEVDMPATIHVAIDEYLNYKRDVNEHLTNKHLREVRSNLENAVLGVRRHGKIILKNNCRIPGTGWKSVLDINEHGFRQFLNSLREKGRSLRCRNLYLQNWMQFNEWCQMRGWLSANPLRGIDAERKQRSRKNRHVERKWNRRSFTREEFEKLVATVEEDRRLVYLAMGLAGLRRGEVKSIEKRDCDLSNMTNPRWRIRPEQQKNRLPASLPMMPRLAKELNPLWESLQNPTDKLFPPFPDYKTLYKDFHRAGVVRQNSMGKLDNHSFRYFFATEMSKTLGMTKVSVLMRHEDMTQTTSVYAQLHLHDKDEEWRLSDI